ncbi:MAG TPA: isocitrate lyase/phosphoenolpyruvate mutase family protein [Solirubrobacterales bacterium]|jgi:2-methylisocitrate lyase-like PEP mutase family enzyme|nr:isocitrate lyase/phosphoenolpyruvate mutase family protein [Solirubrobacterales bacterium]
MSGQADRAERFKALHEGPELLLIPNPWDVGSAKLLASLGFKALATTSGGSAATLGRLDGSMTREEAIASAAAIVAATHLPVSADLENGFSESASGVAETMRLALDAGLAGASVEDYTRSKGEIYDIDVASERVAAAAEAAHSGPSQLVLTARAENHLYGVTDISNTIARLQAYQEAGADVLYAPGLSKLEEIRQVVDSVERPVNVLGRPGAPSVTELSSVGVRRVSVGGAFAYAALGAAVEAARELLDEGTYGYFERAGIGLQAARSAFSERPDEPAA